MYNLRTDTIAAAVTAIVFLQAMHRTECALAAFTVLHSGIVAIFTLFFHCEIERRIVYKMLLPEYLRLLCYRYKYVVQLPSVHRSALPLLMKSLRNVKSNPMNGCPWNILVD